MNKTKIITLLLITVMLAGCGKAKLEDGRELVFEMDGTKKTANDFYDSLKDRYGISVLLDELDKDLLNQEYETTSTMKQQIEAQIEGIKEQTGESFLEAIQYYYGVSTEKALYEYIEMTLKKQTAERDYAKSLISDEDIEKYYNEKAIGDIKASHILIKPETTDDMNTDEIKEAEEKALEKAKELIERLDDGAKFEDLAKEYSQDEGNKELGGDLGYFNRNQMVDEFEEAAIKLKVGEYSKEPVKTTFGYHIILKVDEK